MKNPVKTFSYSVAVAGALTLAPSAFATYITPSFDLFQGSIQWAPTSATGPINASASWADSNTSLSWKIGYDASQAFPWQYTYTWNTSAKDLSHIIIQVSSTATAANFSDPNGVFYDAGQPQTYSPSDPGSSLPGLPGPIYGVKLPGSSTSETFTFYSTQAPTWGDFYAKDGKDGGSDVYAFNQGFSAANPTLDLTGIALGDYTTLGHDGPRANFIATPDTVTAIPSLFSSVPDGGSTLFMFGGGLFAFGLFRRRSA